MPYPNTVSQTPPDEDEVLPVEAGYDRPPVPDVAQIQPPTEAPKPPAATGPITVRRCRRFVNVTSRVRPGKGVKLWAYGFSDLAALFGLSESAVRQAVRRERFDPADLRSVFEYMLIRLADKKLRDRLLTREDEP